MTSLLMVIYNKEEYVNFRNRINIDNHKGVDEIPKLLKQLQNKIDKFLEKYPDLDLGITKDIQLYDISKYPKENIENKINLYKMIPILIKQQNEPVKSINEHYSNLIQVEIRNAISDKSNDVWNMFFRVLTVVRNSFPKHFPNLIDEEVLDMSLKEKIRQRLIKFEKYHIRNEDFNLF